MQLTLTDTQLEKQLPEYSANTTLAFHSFKSFLKLNNIPYSESNGYFKIVPRDESDMELVKRYCQTRQIKLEVLGNV
jgi:hypothetical protein